jgi:hypothetical protein
MKKLLIAISLSTALILCGSAMAKDAGTLQKVATKTKANLRGAQKLLDQAIQRITAAQKANEFDMEGHAAKAKELIEQANSEIKLAAEAAKENKSTEVKTPEVKTPEVKVPETKIPEQKIPETKIP